MSMNNLNFHDFSIDKSGVLLYYINMFTRERNKIYVGVAQLVRALA